jgi:protein-disulfide isomerase
MKNKLRGMDKMSRRNNDELFVVKKYHIYLVIAITVSFIAGMTVRTLLLRPMSYYVASVPPGTSLPTPTSPVVATIVIPTPISSPTVVQPSPTVGIVQVSADDDPALGPEDAPVLIVEFSDFQCSFCARFAEETLGQILDTYGDRVRFVYRDFPITEMHDYAQKAAEATQCANDQGKYWEYSDLLFKNQQALDVDSLKKYAEDLGLNTGAFNECLDSGQYTSEVQKDREEGESYGITGTPTFFINGRMLRGAKPFSAFQAIIEEELAK